MKPLHMFSAWACRNQLVPGQVKTQEKSNEIAAVPELLERLELSGCIVTVDAMGCQWEIAKRIRTVGGDYVLQVKGNQGTLEKEVRAYFDAAEEDGFLRPEIEDEATSEEGRDRIEHRSYFLSTDLSALTVGERWVDLKAIGMVESERYSRDGVSIERRYFIASVDDIGLFHQAVRSHRGIENGLHWRLDVTFREDESRIRRGDAVHNSGVIRHVAMNLLKSGSSKISVRKKRIRAGFNDHSLRAQAGVKR